MTHTVREKQRLLARIRRIRGQVEAIERALEGEAGCDKVMHLLASTRAAMAGLHAGPGRRARIELTGPDALTAAEWRVCRQAAEGRTNREVAQALFLTEKTVERHLSSAYTKLGIRSRFQLAAAIGE